MLQSCGPRAPCWLQCSSYGHQLIVIVWRHRELFSTALLHSYFAPPVNVSISKPSLYSGSNITELHIVASRGGVRSSLTSHNISMTNLTVATNFVSLSLPKVYVIQHCEENKTSLKTFSCQLSQFTATKHDILNTQQHSHTIQAGVKMAPSAHAPSAMARPRPEATNQQLAPAFSLSWPNSSNIRLWFMLSDSPVVSPLLYKTIWTL